MTAGTAALPLATPHLLDRWVDRIAGPLGSKLRLRVQRSLLAALVYVLVEVLRWAGVAAGVVGLEAALVMLVYDLTGVMFFYVMLRSGGSERLRDPSMTLAQILYALGSVVLSYALIEVTRGAALLLLCLVLAFGMYRLSPAQILGTGLVTVGMLAVTLAVMYGTHATGFDVRQEAFNIVLSAVILPTMSVVGKQAKEMRRRHVSQSRELAVALERLEELATRDMLTGLINRRHMLDVLAEERKRFMRSGRSYSLALIDVDHFKRINDTHGHAAGDAVLVALAEVCGSVLRQSDILARWGGEEFLLLMPDTTCAEGVIALERIREAVREHDWSDALGRDGSVTFSAGVTQHDHAEPLEMALERADIALYAAKASGRNRTTPA